MRLRKAQRNSLLASSLEIYLRVLPRTRHLRCNRNTKPRVEQREFLDRVFINFYYFPWLGSHSTTMLYHGILLLQLGQSGAVRIH